MANNKDDWEEIPLKDDWEDTTDSNEHPGRSAFPGADFLRGASEGASMGFHDEIKGALASPMGAAKQTASLLGFSPDITDEDLQKYLDARNTSREDLTVARENSPWATNIGEIAGGFAVPGVGSAKAGMTFGKGLARAAKFGAGAGALGALGTTEEEAPVDVAKDVAAGAGLGALTGGLLEGGTATAKMLKGEGKQSEFGKLVARSYKEGEEGRGFTGIDDTTKRLKEETATTRNLVDQLETTEDKLGKNIQNKVMDATQQGKVITPDGNMFNSAIDFASQLDKRPSLLTEKSTSVFRKLIDNQPINPEEANALRRELRDLTGTLDPKDLDQRDIIQQAQGLSKSLNDKLDTAVEGFKDANAQFSGFRQAGSETALASGLEPDVAGKAISGLRNSTADLNNSINGLVQKLSSQGTTGEAAQKTFMEMEKQLRLFESKNPGLLHKQGFDVDNFLKTVKDQSELTTVRRGIRGYEPQSGTIKQFFNYFSPRGGSLLAANTAGKVVNGLKKNFYKAPPEQLRKVGDALLGNDKLKYLGKALNDAIGSKSEASKNAALFAISQNPAAREVAASLFSTLPFVSLEKEPSNEGTAE